MYNLLQGFKVVEGASFIAAPLCGLTFVQLGADVIRFDQIGGGPDFNRWPLARNGRSFYWEGLNKGKRSIAIDLARPQGRELAAALASAPGESGGHFVTNYPSRGFLSHEKLRARRADIITARVTGSSDGRTALDYTVNCAAGYPEMTGPANTAQPVNHVLPAWDVAAGLTAAVALLAASRERAVSKQGREIQVPLSNVAFGVLSALGNIAEVSTSGQDRPRYGNALFGSFGRDFVTADGRRVMIVAITQRQWTGLLNVLELRDEVAALEQQHNVNFETDEGARFIHRDALFALIEARVAKRDLAALSGQFDANAVCWGEYQSVLQATRQDPRLSPANPTFENLAGQPSGESYLAAGFAGIIGDEERQPLRPAPQLGAHTDEILAGELGLSDGEIGQLHDDKIVAAA